MTVRNDAVSGGQVVDAEGRKGFWSFVKRMLIRETVTFAPNGQKQEYVQKGMGPVKGHGQMLGRCPPPCFLEPRG